MTLDSYENSLISLSEKELQSMLQEKGLASATALTPSGIRLKKALELPKQSLSGQEYQTHISDLAYQNKVFRSFIGMGYYKTQCPELLWRAIYQNPFAFKAEVSEIFSLMIKSLTLFSNSYRLSSSSEALYFALENMISSRKDERCNTLFVDQNIFPQHLDLLLTFCEGLGLDLVQDDFSCYEFSGAEFGAIMQYPALSGEINDYSDFCSRAHDSNAKVTCISNLMALSVLRSPKDWGADFCLGECQQFGLPMAFAGANVAFLASDNELKITESDYNPMATLASFFAVYHGSKGVKNLAERINIQCSKLYQALKGLGAEIATTNFFDTLEVNIDTAVVSLSALERNINFYYADSQRVILSVDECTLDEEIYTIVEIFAEALGKKAPKAIKAIKKTSIKENLLRKDEILTHEIFNKYTKEQDLIRYIKSLESQDINIACIEATKALNMREVVDIHPFAPENQMDGMLDILDNLSIHLATISGLDATSLQANSFEQGEFSAMLTVKAYYQARGQFYRNLVLCKEGYNSENILKSGLKVEYYSDDLEQKVEQYSGELALVIADFDDNINLRNIVELAHSGGAQAYIYTKNIDKLVGLTNAGYLGADITCFNFSRSRGVVCVASHLTDFLPTHCIVECGGQRGITAVNSSAYGDVLGHITSYGYIMLMGEKNLKSEAICKNLIEYKTR